MKSRRSANKYPALDPSLNLKKRYDDIYVDYLDKLTDDEKKWLNDFNSEYVNADFRHKGKRLHPKESKTITLKSGKKKTVDKYKKDCEDRNNARNRCTFGISKATDTLYELDSIKNTKKEGNEEDIIIEKLDAPRKKR